MAFGVNFRYYLNNLYYTEYSKVDAMPRLLMLLGMCRLWKSKRNVNEKKIQKKPKGILQILLIR
jgi:hypothetical protein